MTIEPEYIKFNKRVLYDLRESYILLFCIVTFYGLISDLSIYNLYMFFLLPVYLLFFIQSFLSNKYCIKKIKIEEKKKIVIIEIYKFDAFINKKIISLNNLQITVHRISYSVLPSYTLIIYQNGQKIISQRENKVWKKSDFNQIKNIVYTLKMAK